LRSFVRLVTSELIAARSELGSLLVARRREELAGADDGLGASPAPVSRLTALRAELRQRGLDGFVVPRADEHQGEYVPRRSQRLAWLTGFRGSAGLAIALDDRAAIFIDGRYTLAVRAQVDTDAFVPHQIPEESPETWIAENLPKGGKLGFDPWLVTVDGHDLLKIMSDSLRRQMGSVQQNNFLFAGSVLEKTQSFRGKRVVRPQDFFPLTPGFS